MKGVQVSAELPKSGGPSETPEERTNRNYLELLQGFRVAVTGVQVLFAFLLTVPFAPGFNRVDASERRVYFVSLAAAALASLFYIAPVAQHRVLFRQGMKEQLVKRANLYGMVGSLALAISITAATLLVVDHLFDDPLPLITAGATALLALWLWFVQPAIGRSANGRDNG
jgi:hypothetical protein